MINEDLIYEDLDPTIDSTIFGSQLGSTGENTEIPTLCLSDINTIFRDCDPPLKEPVSFENLQGKVIETGHKTIGFEISDLSPDLNGLKKCLYLIILYMALSIGLWTFQVTLMLNEGIAIMILIFGTILLLIPCIIYWLRYLNRILAQDEDSSTEKSQSDVLSSDDVQDIEMDNRNMAGNPDNFVLDVDRLSRNGNHDDDDDFDYDGRQEEYSLRRQQRLLQLQRQLQQRLLQEQQQQQNEDEPGIEVDKVSDMPRITVAGDLPPPPLDYEKDDNVCPFMIGLPKYLEGTQVEKDLKKSVETSMAISGLPKELPR